MILKFNKFILESFTKEVSSISSFLKTHEKNSNKFLEILRYDCDKNDFLLSSIKGDYLSKKQAHKLPNSKDLLIYWFSLEHGYLFRTYGIDDSERTLDDADFALVFNIKEQKTGARQLKNDRSKQKSGSHFGKSNTYWKRDNLKRYRDIISDRRYPDELNDMFNDLMKYSISRNIHPMEALERARFGMDRRLYNDLTDKLLGSGYGFGQINYDRYGGYDRYRW